MTYFFYHPVARFCILPLIIFISMSGGAQVVTQDSLALVSIYNATGGSSWQNHTNWLSGNVNNWYGVSVVNNRVTKLNLANNSLSGQIPSAITNLDSLSYLNISGNSLTRLPNLSAMPKLDTLLIGSNRLSFRDLQPNYTVASVFTYAPQDSVETAYTSVVLEQSTVIMSVMVDTAAGISNQYQWYRNNDSIPGANANTFNLLCFDSSKQGVYTCRIRNSVVTGITLYRRPITLLFQRLANAGADVAVCDSATNIMGNAPVSGNGNWSLVTGSGNIINATATTTAVQSLGGGNNIFKWEISNNACPASHDYVVVRRDLNPTFASAGNDASTCSPQFILQAAIPQTGTGNWTVLSGTGVVAQPGIPNSAINNLSPGDNILRWQVYNGVCPPAIYDEVKIWRDDSLATVNAGADQSVCPTEAFLGAVIPVHTSGVWTVLSGSGVFTDATDNNTQVTSLTEGENLLLWTVNNSCNYSAKDTVSVTVYNFIHANAGADTTIYYNPLHPYPLGNGVSVGTGGNSQYVYTWSPTTDLDDASAEHAGFLTPGIGEYHYDVTVSDGNTCTATDAVHITVVKEDVLDVPSLFTPNFDGVNDVFYIPGIESYPQNELNVFDRNGQVVFKMNNYNNSWDGGTNEGMLRANEEVKADTYFYVLTLEPGKTQKGYVELKR